MCSMKLFFVVLFVAAAASFASSTLTGEIAGRCILEVPETDDYVDSNPFSEPDMYSTAFAGFGDYYHAEDFTPSAKYDITHVWWWTITTAGVPAPGDLEVLFYDDNPAGGPGTELWSGVPTAVELGNTGVTFAGYTIWETRVTLPDTDYFLAEQDVTYWVSIHRPGADTFYVILDATVEGNECYRIITAGGPWVPGSTTGYPATDTFQIIEGDPYVSLDRGTWGSIKAVF